MDRTDTDNQRLKKITKISKYHKNTKLNQNKSHLSGLLTFVSNVTFVRLHVVFNGLDIC